MTSDAANILERSISTAWARAFLRATAKGVESLSPLVVTVTLGNEAGPETPGIRDALDDCIRALKQSNPKKFRKLQFVNTVANTIFPFSLWNPKAADHAAQLYARFDKVWPRIKRCSQNRRGSYFRRLTAFRPKNPGDEPVNQLLHVVHTYRGGNHRRSALQASIFDPALDHVNSRQLGFPCLHQVSFAPLGDSELAITGYYAMQYVFDRAYGNYLGLCRLGEFIAKELNLTLSRMTCVAATAQLGTPGKGDLSDLAKHVIPLLDGHERSDA